MATIETANVGKAVAARVGTNIREVRTKLGLTQAQLAAPEFSISYISAIERGKIRPSLKALSIFAKRLDVQLTFLLEGSPPSAAEARAVGYSPADPDADQKIDMDLLQASVLIHQQRYEQAVEVLVRIQPDRITTGQVYRLYLLRGQIHLSLNEYQKAAIAFERALSQGKILNDLEYIEEAQNMLGKAYFSLYKNALAHLPQSFTNNDITETLEPWDQEEKGVNIGIVMPWKLPAIPEKEKTRSYITKTVMLLWAVGTLVGFVRYATVGDLSILIYSPVVLMAPLLSILDYYYRKKAE